MEANWTERIDAFFSSPSKFLSCSSPEGFLAELLRELRDDRASYNLKVLLLSPLCQYPALLCPSISTGEETALELMSVFGHCPPKSLEFRCHLLVVLTSVLICSSCASTRSRASQDFLELLLGIANDTSDPHDALLHSLRAAACDCLQELEACCPGVLSQHLELLSGLRQQETSRLHQAYSGLNTLGLRNAVYLLTQRERTGPEELKALLGGNALTVWELTPDTDTLTSKDSPLPSAFTLGAMGRVATLQPGSDCKELRSLLSSLLEESYLLTPLCQAALLHRLVEVVAMVPGVSPTIFRAQLLRLLGTSKVCLLHTALLMKSAFTDSLFSAEDEAFLLKRLVGLSQHPLLSTPEKLFYVDCLLHFPENRPINGGDGDESLPVLLTPRLAAPLVPTVFNDSTSMLARFHLASLVYLEEGEEGEEGEGGRGLAYLYDHLNLLRHIVENRGSREKAVTFFRAVFLFLFHFHQVKRYSEDLIASLCGLYQRHARLAPHLLNLADRTQSGLGEASWASRLLEALQRTIAEAPEAQTSPQDLQRHLKVLARVAEEGEVSQKTTLSFLFRVITSSSSALCVKGDWRLGNGVLGVCRRLLVHPGLDAFLSPLADVLQHLTRHFHDTDIQDHARLYYALLTTLSREKLAGVLSQGGQVKKCALYSMVAESQELISTLTVQQTDGPVLELVRLDRHEPPRPEAGGGEREIRATEPHLSQTESALEAYRAQLHRPDTSDIVLHYRLMPADACDPCFHRLFSVHLHFELTDDHYEEVGDVSVLRVFRDGAPPVVSLRLKPRRPYPTTLRAAATFATRDGSTWHTPLPDVHVAFEQAFAPLPAPPEWGTRDRLRLFEELWGEIVAREEDGSDGATSLFCSEPGELALSAWAEKHFSPYLIANPSPPEKCKVLLFLPPRSHVLLKISSEEDAVQVNIATDNWQLLPHINSFLLDITDTVGG